MFKTLRVLLVVCTMIVNPVILTELSTTNATFGSQVILHCDIVLNETIDDVFWERSTTYGNITLSPGVSGIIGSTPDNPSLIILVASTLDSGLYTCNTRIYNTTTQGNTTELRIEGSSPFVSMKSTSLSGTHGIPFTFYVEIDATPPVHHIYWTKESDNGEIVTINSRTTGYAGGNTSVPSLTISYVRFRDKGLYTCYARNSIGLGYGHTITMEVDGDVPIVSVNALTYTVSFGSAVSLDCTVTAFPNFTRTYWQKLKNDVITTITEETEGVSGSTPDVPTLTIKLVTISDAGSYICFAENSVGVGSSRSTVLIVTGGRPLVRVGKPIYSTMYGTPATLHCDVTGDPPTTIVYWQKKTKGAIWSVITSGGVGTQGINVTQPSLTLVFPVKSDTGEYICFATNPVGSSSSQPTLLTVVGEKPLVSVSSNVNSARYSAEHTLYCSVKSTPVHIDVYWEFRTNVIARKIDAKTSGIRGVNADNPSLTINSVTISDDGLYTCNAVNIVGTGSSQTVRLSFDAAIPFVTAVLPSYSVKEGNGISLLCKVSSEPGHTHVFWQKQKDGKRSVLKEGSTGIIGATIDDPSLTFINLNRRDAGFYICFATNAIGTGSSREIVLEVEPLIEVTATETPIIINQQTSDDTAIWVGSVTGILVLLVSIVTIYFKYCRGKTFKDCRVIARQSKDKAKPTKVVRSNQNRAFDTLIAETEIDHNEEMNTRVILKDLYRGAQNNNGFAQNSNIFFSDCIMFQNKLVFTDPYNNRLVISNLENKEIAYINLSWKPWGITTVKPDVIAVSYNLDNTIEIINISTRNIKITIPLTNRGCWGLSYYKQLLYYVSTSVIEIIDLNGNVKGFIRLPSCDVYSLTVDGERLFYTDKTTVYCCDLLGTIIWKFSDAKYLGLRGVSIGELGNVYATCSLSKNVVSISPNGKTFQSIITADGAIGAPLGVYFDKDMKRLLVSSDNGNAVLVSDIKIRTQ